MLTQLSRIATCSLVLLALGCESQNRVRTTEPAETTDTAAPAAAGDEEQAIVAAAREYLEVPADDSTAISVVAVGGDYAQVLATPPADEEVDPATIFLRKTDGGWEGIALGTAFSREDLDSLGIPEAVRGDYE